ncbi:hypothetical protein SAMN06265221_12114 [Paracoccus laeviglucosivorans]|uniref:Uncharacterized protein n=1 Tax=Paracoccus laeviglucosivorans TaxID=1197861 RepID=A0A521FEG5_9RHOB|nr:hypothetical protein SAMN06265221_12114 [Paracoccus laeviglucosivorans]
MTKGAAAKPRCWRFWCEDKAKWLYDRPSLNRIT